MRVFISHLLNENDINIFEIIETRHFDRLQATSVIGEVHLLNLINELLLFLFIFFIFYIGIHGRKNKNCVAKTLFTNFTRLIASQSMEEFFIILKIRSHTK